jgi:predicted metalloprotease
MNQLTSAWRRTTAAVLGALSLAVPGAALHAASPATDPGRVPEVEVTERDVTAANQKIAAAYSALVQMWTNEYRQIGERFVAPRIARYDHSILTACGVIRPENAEYCPNSNTIYYDEIFVAGMAKLAANALGTDGDMAAVGVIAHEMGHAVAMQLGYHSPDSYENESTADCLAGAFAKQSQHDGYLEAGDIDEAFFGMSLAGDPTLEPTGNRRIDAIRHARLERQSHGTKEQRMANFRTGLNGGAGACLEDFRDVR